MDVAGDGTAARPSDQLAASRRHLALTHLLLDEIDLLNGQQYRLNQLDGLAHFVPDGRAER